MARVVVAGGVGAGILLVALVAGPASAQYRYTDDKGVTRTTQYKLDVPARHRDAAVWIGATGVGIPALSEEARQTKLRDDAIRRIGSSIEQRAPYHKAQAAAAAEQAKRRQQRKEDAPRAVDLLWWGWW
ncbi:MAG TPA: hypothetical protein VKA83_26600 [Methylomirabilota bacterium]|nr:hypothetical protein [Methylomirabilota bacterium]